MPPRNVSKAVCAQGRSRNAEELVRRAFSYVMHDGFARCSSMFVPKLFPSFGMNPCSETKIGRTWQFFVSLDLYLLAGEGNWGRGRRLSALAQPALWNPSPRSDRSHR